MTRPRFELSLTLASAGVLVAMACTPKPATTTPEPEPAVEAAPAEGGRPEGEAGASAEAALESVRPGVNDRYFEDGAVTKWTKVLERERREVIEHRDEIVAALELQPGMTVADIGAGTGAFLAPLSAGVGPEGEVYAVDIVPAFLEHLRSRAADEGLENVEVREATDTAAPLAPGSVDLLFVCDVYHHLEYPSAYLRSLAAALAPGGRLVIVEFDKVPGETSAGMMKHVRQDKATLLEEVQAEGFVLAKEIEDLPLEENYMLVFER